MKSGLLMILLLMGVITSCDEDDIPTFESVFEQEGYFSRAVLNDKTIWEANRCQFFYNKLDEIHFYLRLDDSYGYISELIRFLPFSKELVFNNNHPTRIDLKYQRRGNTVDKIDHIAFFDTFHGGDASTECYDLIDSFDNYLEIIGFSEDSTEVYGKYQLALEISDDCPMPMHPTRPNVLVFKNGEFKARYLGEE